MCTQSQLGLLTENMHATRCVMGTSGVGSGHDAPIIDSDNDLGLGSLVRLRCAVNEWEVSCEMKGREEY